MGGSDASKLRYYAARYHAVDWLLLVAMGIIVTVIYESKQPFCRPFLWTDATISYPMKEDTFPNYSLVLMILFGLLFILLSLWCIVQPARGCLPEPLTCCGTLPCDYTNYYHRLRENLREGAAGEGGEEEEAGGGWREGSRAVAAGRGPVFQWVLMYLWGVGLQLLLVQLLKTYTGRLRPDYISRLAKVYYTPTTYHLSSAYKHNQTLPDPMHEMDFFCELMKTHPILKEGRLSFPSGHSSISFSVATLLYFFLAAHLRPYARQGSFARLIFCMLPFSFALICSVSRTRDNKHNHSDIFAGGMIGVWSAWMAFHMSFRSAGGAAELYLARSDRDVELQLLQRQIQLLMEQYQSRLSELQEPACPVPPHSRSSAVTEVVVIGHEAAAAGDAPSSAAVHTRVYDLVARGLEADSSTVQWI
ncbi:phosphatidic acid phosphatase [Strigomonas culicis]|uniref:Phosphatidic acid phosphatase n=1 Tax=Strigomonas culicis TaxID=28005 RepID=S9ULT4_9TRYP|nr:phosphatidic acid phosphatase [Strigomonas culicis]|eukprot:EPY29913.1 phosphatidic acid phosphatase [Strigomonas culicis]